MPDLVFPPGFLWGTATSSHQVEGGNSNNQWWDWEQQPGRIWHGDRSGDACGWWQNTDTDFDAMVRLGQNAHRFSVEWSRLEPRENEFDASAFVRYRQMLEGLQSRGITPMLTLHHFSNPRWLEAKGAWLDAGTPARFARLAERVVRELGDGCTLWCTINEAGVYAAMGYLFGEFPPGEKSVPLSFQVYANMLKGHVLARQAIKAVQPHAQVGFVHQVRHFDPASSAPRDVMAAWLLDYLYNGSLLKTLKTGRLFPPLGVWQEIPGLRGSNDFLGLNYYTRDRVAFDSHESRMAFTRRFTPAEAEHSDNGRSGEPYGEIYAEGLYRALKRIEPFNVPVYITEFGLPDHDDDQRPAFLVRHLHVLHRAIQEGMDVRGVFHWSLVDNFEWAEGWSLRFGLIGLDEKTGVRTQRPSAQVYAEIAKANAIPGHLLERFVENG